MSNSTYFSGDKNTLPYSLVSQMHKNLSSPEQDSGEVFRYFRYVNAGSGSHFHVN